MPIKCEWCNGVISRERCMRCGRKVVTDQDKRELVEMIEDMLEDFDLVTAELGGMSYTGSVFPYGFVRRRGMLTTVRN